MSTTSQTVAQHSTERQMYKPIVIRNRRWWQPWKQDSIVNLALLARWSDLRCDLEKLTAARAVLEEDFAMLQSQHQQARRTIIWRAIEKVKWAAEPTRVKPRGIPGLSLELGIIAAHALVIGAYAIV